MKSLLKVVERKAKQRKAHILIAEGWDDRVLQAVHDLKSTINFTLLGNPKTILEKVKKNKLNLGKTQIIDHKRSEKRQELAKALYQLRKHKGITPKQAEALLDDVNYFGCMMVKQGYAEGIASSVICPTADIMRPALQILKKKNALTSMINIVEDTKNKRVLALTDCMMNIHPDEKELQNIAENAIGFYKMLGIPPKVALLSFSTKGSGGNDEELQKIRNVTKKLQKKYAKQKVIVDGEMQFDAAVNPVSAKKKCPDSLLKGNANVLVLPNLMAGNVLFHSVLQLSDAKIAYNIAVGTQKPVTVLGRTTPLATVKGFLLANAMICNAK